MCPAPLSERLRGFTLATRNLVMYPHLNAAGRLFGGLLMSWIDEASAMAAAAAMQHRNIATKKFGEVIFDAPGKLGDAVEIWCRTAREGNTSITLECLAVVEREGAEKIPICSCSVVYVALDANGKPTPWGRAPGA